VFKFKIEQLYVYELPVVRDCIKQNSHFFENVKINVDVVGSKQMEPYQK